MKVSGAELRSLAGSVNLTVELADVRVTELHAEASAEAVPGILGAHTSLTAAAKQSGSSVAVTSEYVVTARLAPDAETMPGDADPLAWRIHATLLATFVATSDHLDHVALQAFAISTGAVAIHPFARELVQSTSARLGYPPFTMELMRSPWSLPDAEEIELMDPQPSDPPLSISPAKRAARKGRNGT